MSHTTKAQSAALASVCRLVTAAETHEQETITVEELRAVLGGVDVEGLANPRPIRGRSASSATSGSPSPLGSARRAPNLQTFPGDNAHE